ncbi:MAG: segregation/condensation protein A [Chitinophagales bacterium]|nr:segregation/condensation protein A [Chitinophagales bacterium]HAE13294.1 chromosome segregation protein ScpA [Bacteroidota bacterium]MCB9019648.1 segregation/condensation protein A [Chitinophagales bacterium]MCB9021128.1 segregation/condensation protein A [Chitinophagales bacterium]HPE96503.1 segregation/condensation protein A [Chitinophagales bacterium]
MASNETFEIKLPQFEGPFDLLLFFIERDELDIYDIPISRITNDFLDYIHQMNQLNIEVASEFILVAATLMRIKAKMLLPRKELDEFGNEIDPRKELVDRLVEYKRYKDVLEELGNLEDQRRFKMQRGNIQAEHSVLAKQFSNEMELSAVNLFTLLKVFEKVMERYRHQPEEVEHVVFQYNYTIEEEADNVISFCKSKDRVDFEELFSTCADRHQAIFRFLSVLDLIQLQRIDLLIGEGFNQFWVSYNQFREDDAA